MESFKDHFSRSAEKYADYRPGYPEELADFLAAASPRLSTAWEAGCGSGQFTSLLSARFDKVFATDASTEQLDRAPRLPNVDYRRVRAEESGLPSHSADLCVAAQAAHWFDLEAYYAEIRRVGRPGSVVALLTYGMMHVNNAIDPVIHDFYANDTDPFWPPERRLVEAGYSTIPFPFDQMPTPEIDILEEWTMEQFLGYVGTWSGVRAMLDNVGSKPFETFRERIAGLWDSETKPIRWPLSMRVGVVNAK